MHASEAKAMHPKIKTEEGIAEMILLFELNLLKHDKEHPIKPVIKALRLVMKHTVFNFGNAYYLQKDGAAINTPPVRDRDIQMFAFFEIALIGPLF